MKKYITIIICLIILTSGFFVFTKYNSPKFKGTAIKVLFIGNSFTYVNDLPKMVSDIAQSLGDKIEYDMSAPGGYSLMQHSKDQNTLSKIKSKSWDFVVLQDQSEFPALQDSRVENEVIPYALKLNDDIHLSNYRTKIIFFETWGYKTGDTQYCNGTPTLCNYESMQEQLFKSYSKMAQKTDDLLAPIGEAWKLSQQTHPEIELYESDNRHPSPEGTYLSACIFYMKFFNKDVIGASNLSISSSYAKILQQIAEQTVFGR